MTTIEQIMARRFYDFERAQPNRSFASDHGFEEWLEHVASRGYSCQPVKDEQLLEAARLT
jgi:hypothetical protein